jgi:FG-GAP-like repeat
LSYRKLVGILEDLCQETTLTKETCDNTAATDPWKSMIRNLLMSSYLRLGENENCRENHSFESCLLPLKGKAVHIKPEGSSQALKYLEVELVARPENIGAKWLLNVAHMTLGTYPDKVPAQWLIDPKFFQSEYDIKTFPNVIELLGIESYTSMGTGILDDFIGQDGLKDLFQCSASYNRDVKLYRNLGNGKFEDRTEAAGLKGISGGANCRQADFNNDGHLDIFIMRGGWLNLKHVNSIIRNNGDGTFTDITFKTGITSIGATHSMDFADINRDGLLDFFVANEDVACELWLNQGHDTFTNVADLDILNCGLVKGMVFTDYNDDMWPDIMLSRYSGKNRLLRNDGNFSASESGKWSFTDVSVEVGLGDPWFSFPTTSFDADQDGSLDILVGGHLFEGPDAVCWIYTNEDYFINSLHTSANPGFGGDSSQKLTHLFLNKGGKFVEIGAEGGLRRHIMSMAMNYGDLDNDGFLDLYFGTGQPDIRALQPNRMYRNAGGSKFQDVTTSGNFGHLQKGHGIAFADLDNDGDMDVYGQMGGAFYGDFFHDAIYLNPGHDNHFVKFELRGIETNYKAIGSRVYVHTFDAEGNPRVLHHFVSTGGSYGSNPLEGHVGTLFKFCLNGCFFFVFFLSKNIALSENTRRA